MSEVLLCFEKASALENHKCGEVQRLDVDVSRGAVARLVKTIPEDEIINEEQKDDEECARGILRSRLRIK